MNDHATSLPPGLPAAPASAPDRSRWFERTGWRYGSPEFHAASLLAYVFVALFPVAAQLFGGFAASAWPAQFPLIALLWAMFVAFAYPAWAWFEARAFERWAAGLDAADRAVQAQRFAGRVAHARLFWIAVLITHAVIALLGIAATR